MKRFSLLSKFVILMTLLAVIPVLIIGWRALYLNKKVSKKLLSLSSEALKTTLLDYQTNIALNYADKITTYFDNILQNLSIVISPQFSRLSLPERKRFLASIYATSRNLVAVGLIKDNYPVIRIPDNFNFSKKDILEVLREVKGHVELLKIGDVYFEKGIPYISIVYSIKNNESVVVIATLKDLWERIENEKFGAIRSGYVFLVDKNGRVIAHPNRKKAVLKEDVSDIDIVKAIIVGRSVGSKEFRDKEGIPMVGAYAPIEITGWGVIAVQPKSDAYATLFIMQSDSRKFTNLLRRQTLYFIIIFILIASFIAYLEAKSLSKPILTLIEGAKRVAKREFTKPVVLNTKDELNDLAQTFNMMMKELKRYDDIQADKLDAIVFSIADGLILLDKDAKLLLANKQAQDILKIEPKENKIVFELIGEERVKERIYELWQSLKEKEEKDWQIEIDLSLEDVPRYFLALVHSVKTRQGEEIGYVIVIRDITLDKEIERMRDEFLHSITHDLRSPMTSIRGFLEVLKNEDAGPLNEQQKSFLEIMDNSSERLLGLINDLLDTAKMEAGKFLIKTEEFNLGESVKNIVNSLKGQAIKQGIELLIEFSGHDFVISADKQLIERIFINLIGNALKFTPSGGRITVRIFDRGDEFVCEVEDTGEGIPPEYVDKIFDKFQQVGRKKGTGLGLTICRYIVEGHGGSIKVESKLGEGSKFSFRLPKKAKSENG